MMSYKATYFESVDANSARPDLMKWDTADEFAEFLRSIHVPVKTNAPLLKMARFNGIRNDANVVEFYGAQPDADSLKVTVEQAHAYFQMLEIEAVFHATHSEGVKPEHCWRAFARFSKPLDAAGFHEQASKMNGLLQMIDPEASFAAESWTPSQPFYIGSGHEVLVSHGQLIDTVEGIELADGSGARKTKRYDAPPVATVPYQGPTTPADEEERERLLAIISTAPEGRRHQLLFVGTAGLYRLVSGGRLPEDGLLDDILAAAADVGLDESNITNQLTRGREMGMANPLTLEREAEETKAYWDERTDARWDEMPAPEIPPGGREVPPEEHEANEEAARLRREEQRKLHQLIGEGGDDAPMPAIMTLEEMARRLVLVGGTHVADMQTGRNRGAEAAAREYAASLHNWVEDEKPKSAPAIKLWLQSTTRISVDGLTWQPGQNPICKLPEVVDAGDRGLNTWRGLPPLPVPDNWRALAQPFLEHVAYLVPVEAERRRFLQWLAHIVQHPEILPHTSYLFVTPSFGIGRNWMAYVIVRVLSGHAAAGLDLAQTLLGSYNGRLSRKLIAIVDEVREGIGSNRYTLGEKLKQEITAEVRHINPKFGLQSVEKNCCRWLMFSQHYDAVPLPEGDRRVIVIENPTVGRAPEYYSRLYGMLDNPSFIGAVRQYLATLDLTGFNPGEHAPMNAAKQEAIESMLSPVDVAIREYLDECDKPLVALSAIRHHITLSDPGAKVSGTHLRHALQRAGIGKGRRIRLDPLRIDTVAPVTGRGWTTEMVHNAPPDTLKAAL